MVKQHDHDEKPTVRISLDTSLSAYPKGPLGEVKAARTAARTPYAILRPRSAMTRATATLYRNFTTVCCPACPSPPPSRWARTRCAAAPGTAVPLFRLTTRACATTLGGVALANPLILAAMY